MYSYGSFKLSVPAEDVGQELDRIREVHGILTPELVVNEAKDESNPLHNLFDWNNKTAARKWRIEQARHIIRAVVITTETAEPVTIRAFLNSPEKYEYKPFSEIMQNNDDYSFVLAQAKREMESFKRKYTALKILPQFTEELIMVLQ